MSDFRSRIAALGKELSPALLQGTGKICAPTLTAPDPGTIVSRDHRYGPHERNRLDTFAAPSRSGVPVVVYVHGGGFIQGDKNNPGSPFYDNVGHWAVANGMMGVTVTYRLAPGATYPSGIEDMRAAIGWIREHAAEHGGDPERIYLVGQSAGASHVASYVAAGGEGLAGAVLVSCIFEIGAAQHSPMHAAYYGEDRERYGDYGTTAALIASPVPLLSTVSEFDTEEFQRQAGRFAAAWSEETGQFPRLLWLEGHNHLSPAQALGGEHDLLGPALLLFIADTAN